MNNFHFNIIKAAFINGYIRALRVDIDEIELVKDDMKELRKLVRFETEKYMEEGAELNRETYRRKATKDKDTKNAYSRDRWW